MRSLLLILSFCLSTSAFSAEKITVLAVPLQHASSPKLLQEKKLLQKQALRARPVFGESESLALAKFGDAGLGESLILEFSSGKSLEKFRLWAKSNIHNFKIEKDPIARATEDPLSSLQWALKNNGADYAVSIDDFNTKKIPGIAGEDVDLVGTPKATKKIIVAVLDSGVDIDHPDLQAAIAQNDLECKALVDYQACVSKQGTAKCDPQFQVDHDGNGYPLDCHGWNFAAEDDGQGMSRAGALPKTTGILGNTHVADYIGHGTHVAGIIAAQSNGIGVEGVAPDAVILPVRVISGEPNEVIRAQDTSGALPAPQESNFKAGYGLGDIVARGVLYAVRSGAQVLNMSLGWPDPLDSELLRRILAVAHSQGVIVVAAAGNDSTDSVIFPCRYDGVICVGAHGPDGALTFFSNFGHGVDILAPGWNIVSTFPTGLLPLNFTDQVGYESKDGTSMAAPFVSGLLARMLGSGMSSDEAYSRLLLGARPTRDSQVEDPKLFANSSLSGNADLANSYKVSPQALILPAHKDVVRLSWDRVSKQIPIEFSLTDHWQDAKNVFVSIQPMDADVSLKQSRFSLPQWNALEDKTLSTSLNILNPRVNSEIDFRVRVAAKNMAVREFYIRAEIYSPVGIETPASADTKILPLVDQDGQNITRQFDDVRTVSLDQETGREYLGIRKENGNRVLELFRESPTPYGNVMALLGSLSQVSNGNQISTLKKIHDLKTHAAVYVLIETLPVAKGVNSQTGESQLTWLDEKLSIRADHPVLTVDRNVSYLSEDFEWQAINGELAPTWYSFGRVPVSERPVYNPWDPKAETAPDFRMYYLASDGLHGVALPKEYSSLVSLLPQNDSQKQSGVVSVLLANGDNYDLTYASAEFVEGAWRNVQPITLPTYHNLRGIIANPIFSLDPSTSFAGTAFSGFVSSSDGPSGSRRTSILAPTPTADLTAHPLRNFDSVTDITGVFAGSQRKAEFSLTKYEIQYHDFTNQKTAMITQKRFSFLPDIFSMKSFFPLLAQDSKLGINEPRVGALFVPGDFIYSKDTQVIMPSFVNGQVVALKRPAKFHLESESGCSALATAKAADQNGPAELVFFCGDRFLSAPLRY